MYTSIYNPYVPQEAFLAHHGIMGQRWGKKNGPPYPLSAGAHSASEKKAGWRKSLAAAGRGTVKVAKAVGRGTVKTAKFVNKAAVRMGVKPKKLMSDEEIAYSINRLRQEKAYKRALKGKFVSVEEAERNKGKGAVSQLMGAIGKEVIIPTTVGALRYALATKLAGEHIEGEKVISKVETIFGGGKGVGFRNSYFYDKHGNPKYRESNKKKKGENNGNGNNHPKEQTQQPQQPKEQNEPNQSKAKKKKKTKAIDVENPVSQATKTSKWIETLSKTKPINDAMKTSINSLNSSDTERWADRLSRIDAIDTPMQSLGSGSNEDFIRKLSKMGKIV